jgi:hypothetical protein
VDNAGIPSSSFHPIISHAQIYQDIDFHTIVDTTGFQKNCDIFVKRRVLVAKKSKKVIKNSIGHPG